MIGSMLKNGEDVVNYKLRFGKATDSVTSLWYQGLTRADQGMKSSLIFMDTEAVEWQRLIPFMVKSFQLAGEIIQKSKFSDQISLNNVHCFGLGIPLRFLLPFGDVAAKWRLRCALQVVRLIIRRQKRLGRCFNDAEDTPLNCTVPAKSLELDVLRTAVDLVTQCGEDHPKGLPQRSLRCYGIIFQRMTVSYILLILSEKPCSYLIMYSRATYRVS